MLVVDVDIEGRKPTKIAPGAYESSELVFIDGRNSHSLAVLGIERLAAAAHVARRRLLQTSRFGDL